MRIAIMLVIAVTCSFAPASAGEQAANKTTAKTAAKTNVKPLTESEKSRIKHQVDALQQSKIQTAEQANKGIKDAAVKQGQSIDQRVKQVQDQNNNTAKGMPWLSGAAAQRNAALSAQAEAEKQKVAVEAKKRAAAQTAAAKKSVENINQSVDGLKSQVSKDGKFGLKPQGSNLNVRNYGKN
jgi:hypothetical protein